MKRLYRPGVALIGSVAVLGIAWPFATAGQGVFGPGGAAGMVIVAASAIGLLSHPLSRSRPSMLALAATLSMTPYVAFLIGCILLPSVPTDMEPMLPRSVTSLLAFIGSMGALAGFLLSIVRVIQIRGGHHHAAAE